MKNAFLPQLNVYFWLMMLPLIPRWVLLLCDIEFRTTLATIYQPSRLSHSTDNLYISPHQRLMNYGTEPMTILKQSNSPTIKPTPRTQQTAMAHDSIISRKRYSKSVITQLKQTDCLLNASDSWAVRSPPGVAGSYSAVERWGADGDGGLCPHPPTEKTCCIQILSMLSLKINELRGLICK